MHRGVVSPEVFLQRRGGAGHGRLLPGPAAGGLLDSRCAPELAPLLSRPCQRPAAAGGHMRRSPASACSWTVLLVPLGSTAQQQPAASRPRFGPMSHFNGGNRRAQQQRQQRPATAELPDNRRSSSSSNSSSSSSSRSSFSSLGVFLPALPNTTVACFLHDKSTARLTPLLAAAVTPLHAGGGGAAAGPSAVSLLRS